jgi:hypothetical protein
MSAWERERGALPAPVLSLFRRKTGQGLLVSSIDHQFDEYSACPLVLERQNGKQTT